MSAAELLWTALDVLSCCLMFFGAGVLVGRWCTLEEPRLREPMRPGEAAVEEWA